MGQRWRPGPSGPCCLLPTPSGYVTTRKYSPATPPVQLWRKDDGQVVYGVRLDNFGDLDICAYNGSSDRAVLTQYATDGVQQWSTVSGRNASGFLAVDSSDTLVSSIGHSGEVVANHSNDANSVGYLMQYSDTGSFDLESGASGHFTGTAIDGTDRQISVPASIRTTNCRINTSGQLTRGIVQGGGPFVIDGSDNLYCGNCGGAGANLVRKLSAEGKILWSYSLGAAALDLSLDSTGRLLVLRNTKLVCLDGSSGAVVWQTTLTGTQTSIAVDLATDDIYVSGSLTISFVNYAVQQYDSSGALQWSAGVIGDWTGGTAQSLLGMACAFANSKIYVATSYADFLGTLGWRMVSYDGTGAEVDDYSAAATFINAMAVDSSGNVYATADDATFAYGLASAVFKFAPSLTTPTTFVGTDGTLYIDAADTIWTVDTDLYGMDTSGTVTEGPFSNRTLSIGAYEQRKLGTDSTGNLWLFSTGYEPANYWVRDNTGESLHVSGYPSSLVFYAAGAVVEKSGDVYVAGTDSFTGTNPSITPASGHCVQKFTGGLLQWQGPVGPIGYAVAVDSSDNVYVGGSRESSITTLKLDSSGSIVWSVDHGAAVYAIAVDASGNVYTGGAVAGDGKTTRKYNSSGTLLWSVNHGDTVYSIDVDSSGNVYTGGVRTPLP